MAFIFTKDRIAQTEQGVKVQTRRPRKPNQHPAMEMNESGDLVPKSPIMRVYSQRLEKGTVDAYWPYKVYVVGAIHAIRPGRTAKGVGFVEIVGIRSEDVRTISHADTIAEGFRSRVAFLMVWCGFYDPKPIRLWNKMDTDSVIDFMELIESRPADLYDAWAITYKYLGVTRPVSPDKPKRRVESAR